MAVWSALTHSSGCLLYTSIKDGHTTVGDPAEADIIIINTCGFIESAKTEAIENILMACQYKQQNPALKVIVTGCLAERYKQQIIQEIPEVDAVVGIGSNAALPAIVRRLCADGAGQTLSLIHIWSYTKSSAVSSTPTAPPTPWRGRGSWAC